MTATMKTTDEIMGLVDRAYHLGQIYWQQADSDSWSENKKSQATVAKWLATKDEIRAALTASMDWKVIADSPVIQQFRFVDSSRWDDYDASKVLTSWERFVSDDAYETRELIVKPALPPPPAEGEK